MAPSSECRPMANVEVDAYQPMVTNQRKEFYIKQATKLKMPISEMKLNSNLLGQYEDIFHQLQKNPACRITQNWSS